MLRNCYRQAANFLSISRHSAGSQSLMLAAMIALALLATLGCQRDERTVEGSAEPSIAILSPQPNTVIDENKFTVEVEINNFILDPLAIGNAKVPGYGHWHLYLDGEWFGASAENTLDVSGITPGPHHLRAAIANNDHSLLVPSIEHNIVVEITADATETNESAEATNTPHFVSSTPEHGAELYSAPEFVQVTFDFELAPESSITIEKDGVPINVSPTTIGSDKQSMFVTLNEHPTHGYFDVYYSACWPLLNCHKGSFSFEIEDEGYEPDGYDYDYEN